MTYEQAVDPMDTPLPCDVVVGRTRFIKGVALRVLVCATRNYYEKDLSERLPDGRRADGKLEWPSRLTSETVGLPPHAFLSWEWLDRKGPTE